MLLVTRAIQVKITVDSRCGPPVVTEIRKTYVPSVREAVGEREFP